MWAPERGQSGEGPNLNENHHASGLMLLTTASSTLKVSTPKPSILDGRSAIIAMMRNSARIYQKFYQNQPDSTRIATRRHPNTIGPIDVVNRFKSANYVADEPLSINLHIIASNEYYSSNSVHDEQAIACSPYADTISRLLVFRSGIASNDSFETTLGARLRNSNQTCHWIFQFEWPQPPECPATRHLLIINFVIHSMTTLSFSYWPAW